MCAVVTSGPSAHRQHTGTSDPVVVESPGIDRRAVTDWLLAKIPDLQPPVSFAQIVGGRSNLTFFVTDGSGAQWVLRRPPLGHVLKTAHDMAREFRILSALQPSYIPVPVPVALCRDESITGAAFYVMERVAGHVLRTRQLVEETVPTIHRNSLGASLVDLLSALHSLPPAHVGLADLGRGARYIERQLHRWRAQVGDGSTDALPLILEVHAHLTRTIPAASRLAIVHGDFRLDNCVVSETGKILALLDWELCTLGDPLADLGMLLVYWSEPGDAMTMLDDAPTTASGFPDRAAVLERYSSVSGADLSAINFYLAFAFWKLACIVEGVHVRLAAGTMGASDVAADVYADKAVWLAEEAHRAIALI